MAVIPNSTVSSFSKRYGRIILMNESTEDIAPLENYRFWTLQATGIQIPFMEFTLRKTKNRLDAMNAIRKLVAPNYVITTHVNYATDKIWGIYLNQKQTADRSLRRVLALNYTSDEDVYTRVVVFGKNKSPKNLMLEESVNFITPDQSYSGQAVELEMLFKREQDDFLIYEPNLTAAGRILSTPRPIVYINGVPINGETVELLNQQVRVLEKQTITTEQGK